VDGSYTKLETALAHSLGLLVIGPNAWLLTSVGNLEFKVIIYLLVTPKQLIKYVLIRT